MLTNKTAANHSVSLEYKLCCSILTKPMKAFKKSTNEKLLCTDSNNSWIPYVSKVRFRRYTYTYITFIIELCPRLQS